MLIKIIRMKKLILVVSIVLTITACSNEFDDTNYTINNNSSKTVSFLFNSIHNNLNSSKSMSFTINSNKGIFYPKNVAPDNAHLKSIKMDTLNLGTKGYIFTFNDNPKFKLDVINTLPIEVTIKSDDYIDNVDDNGEYTLTIPENSKIESFIYTSKPNFTLVSEPETEIETKPENETESITLTYPVTFDWAFNDNIIYVIIR